MTHRADAIVSAVVTALTGLTTTGTNIERGRVYDLDASQSSSAISVFMGSDEPTGEYGQRNIGFIDSDQTIIVRSHVRSVSTQIDSILSTIRREVHVALQASNRLGLDYVTMLYWAGSSDPDESGDGSKPSATQDNTWVVRYRAPLADPEE